MLLKVIQIFINYPIWSRWTLHSQLTIRNSIVIAKASGFVSLAYSNQPTTLAKKLKVIAIFLIFNEYLGKSLNLLWQIFFAIWTHFYCCILNKQSRRLVTLSWYCMKHLHLLFNHLSV